MPHTRFDLWLRRAGLIVGMLLLAGAVVAVWRQRDTLSQAVQFIRQLPNARLTLGLGMLGASVVLNIVLSALLFSLLIWRYGRVGVLEMQALIAAATLMNYLPMRPGFFGRIAYHKVVNQIAVFNSTKTVAQAIGLSVMIALYLALAMIIASKAAIDLRLLAIAPLPLLSLGALTLKEFRIWLWAAALRYTEVLIIAARYFASFALIGSPIDGRGALAFACISIIATMVPFLSNGLGMREWAIGLAAPLLTAHQMEVGITADLLNRAVELIVVAPCGLAGTAWLARRHHRCARAASSRIE